jgi:hypothetical protein
VRMRKTTGSRPQVQSALVHARARLFSAASRAHAAGRLSDEQLVRVRITLKGAPLEALFRSGDGLRSAEVYPPRESDRMRIGHAPSMRHGTTVTT